jgi:hypothetical protein
MQFVYQGWRLELSVLFYNMVTFTILKEEV